MKKIILIICLTCITTIQAQENDINEKYKKYEKMFFELKVPITPVIAFNSEQFPEVSGTIQLDKNDNIKKRNDYKNYLKNEIKLIKNEIMK
jgi:Fe2+ transport system protein B